MTLTRRTLLCAAASLGAPAFAAHAPDRRRGRRARCGSSFPTAPGGSPDMVARMLGNKLTERLGQPVVVESIVQGVGLVGNQMVSRAAPDGSTFAMLTGGFTTQAGVMKSLPYDPVHGFSFVTTVVTYPMFLLVAPNSPIASFPDFLERAKREPGKLNYRDHRQWQRLSPARQVDRKPGRHRVGRDSLPRLGRSLHRRDRRPGRRHAGYRDVGDLPHPQRADAGAGGVVARALSLMPDVPTMNGAVPGIELMSWLGLATAPQTPRPIIDKLNAEVRRALDLPDVKQWLAETGVLAAPATPEEFRRRIESEIALYTKLAEANGITSRIDTRSRTVRSRPLGRHRLPSSPLFRRLQ